MPVEGPSGQRIRLSTSRTVSSEDLCSGGMTKVAEDAAQVQNVPRRAVCSLSADTIPQLIPDWRVFSVSQTGSHTARAANKL
jgi:hypothetical protein